MNAINKDELHRQLVHVHDPITRLQLLLQHGFVSDAETELRAIVAETQPIYFQEPSRCHGEQIGKRVDGTTFMVCVGLTKSGLSPDRSKLFFDHEGLRMVMGWTEQQRDEFMMNVMRRAITIVDPTNLQHDIAGWAGSWEINATVEAMERFVPQGHELRKSVERWCLRGWFFQAGYISHYFSDAYREKWIGKKSERIWHGCLATWKGIEDVLHRERDISEAVIVRLRELGMSDLEIREDCYAWLDRHVNHLNPDLLTSVANTSIFEYGDARRAVVMERQVDTTMRSMMNGEPLGHPLIVARLIDGGMSVANIDVCARYRKHVAQALAEGRIGLVTEITTMIGHRFFGVSRGRDSDPKPKFELRECVASAFDIAWRKGRYGIAAALVIQFGEEACLDQDLMRKFIEDSPVEVDNHEGVELRLARFVEERKATIRTAYDLAKMTSQPMMLDYDTVFTPRML